MSIEITLPFPPNVPQLPGVPPLAGYIAAQAIQALTADAPGVAAQTAQMPQWGIFKDGQKVINPDSIRSVSPSKEWRLLDYPTEDGSFQTYNKVEMPREVEVEMLQGGSDSDLYEIISTLDQIAGDLNLYDVITPDVTYTNENVERYSYERTGSQLLTIRVQLRQIRITASAAFSNTVAPISASTTDAGTVQPQMPTAGQTAATAGGAQ